MKWYDASILYLCIITCILSVGSFVMITEVHDWAAAQEAAAKAEAQREGWKPPRIVHFENCALWDEIRHECEDD